MLVPLYGFVKGDSMGVVVLVHDTHTVRELGERLIRAVLVRVRRPPATAVWWRGQVLDPSATVAQVGLQPLDRVELIPEAPVAREAWESRGTGDGS
ncbi:MAG TPA: toluene-4-monooxygenase system B family protein [Myxococcales bacterium]|nr:toluene-4-monooxygenase system B family protein [Myxococcales bacterium]